MAEKKWEKKKIPVRRKKAGEQATEREREKERYRRCNAEARWDRVGAGGKRCRSSPLKRGGACKRRTINQNPLSCRSVSLKSEQTGRPWLLLPARAPVPILNADISRHEQSRAPGRYILFARRGIYGYRADRLRSFMQIRESSERAADGALRADEGDAPKIGSDRFLGPRTVTPHARTVENARARPFDPRHTR